MGAVSTFVVDLGERSYPIYIGGGLLGQSEYLTPHLKSESVLIVSNDTVAPIYLERLKACLSSATKLEVVILQDGEQYKNLENLNLIFDQLLTQRFGRDVTLIALGGGVVGDMTGFAAACYQRGVAFIQIPTTLLSQVDSSVGGKTGVNHALGKNMIGAFYQPQCVIADPQVLKTLPERELSAGMAEVIKYGAIGDIEFFNWLEANMPLLMRQDEALLVEAIQRSCQNKARVVAEDEFESGIRAILNFGHTFGHAIETGMGYGAWLHGEAVGAGMCIAAHVSRAFGLLQEQDVSRIVSLCKAAGLPVMPPEDLDSDRMLELMRVDKKNKQGVLRLVLLDKLGKAVIVDQQETETLRQAMITYSAENYL